MISRDSLLVALVAAVAGMGAGFLFASLLDSSRPAEASEAVDAVKPSPTSSAGTSRSTDRLEASPREMARAPAVPRAQEVTPRVSDAEFQRAFDDVDAPKINVVPGIGAITGEVLDDSGAPIAGAEIVLDRSSSNRASSPTDVGTGAPSEPSLEEYLQERAQSWAKTRGGRKRAISGDDGGFEITGLIEDASYRVRGYLEDHVLSREGSWAITPGQHVIFRAKGVHSIPVQFVYEDGRRATEGVVGVERGDDRETFYAWSSESPTLRLTAGRVGVTGYAGLRESNPWGNETDSTYGSEQVSLDVVTQAGTPLVLELKARSGIRGNVIDNFAVGTGQMVVRLLPMAPGAELNESALAESDRQEWLHGSRFQFLDLTPGTYAVGLSNWNEALFAHAVVTVGAGVAEVDLVVPEPDAKEHLVVRAFGPLGNPLHDLDFGWQRRSGRGSSSSGLEGRRGPDGAWWLQPKAEFFEPWPKETTYTLTITHSQLGYRDIVIEEGQREVTVRFEEPVSIVVTVAGYAGSGYEGKLRVGLRSVGDGEDSDPWNQMRGGLRGNDDEQFTADGVSRLDGLSPGRWEVSLQVETERWRTRTVQKVEVDVLSGEKSVAMDLPALYDLTVIAPGLADEGRLQLRPVAGDDSPFGSSSAQVDSDGRAVFRALAAGDYILTGNGVPDSVNVTVPCGDVYLDTKAPDCLRVAIGDMEGALYQAGLRAGDLIIGSHGEEFESVQNAWNLLIGEGEIVLMVLRDGRQIDITMDLLDRTGNWFESLGGMLSPASRE